MSKISNEATILWDKLDDIDTYPDMLHPNSVEEYKKLFSRVQKDLKDIEITQLIPHGFVKSDTKLNQLKKIAFNIRMLLDAVQPTTKEQCVGIWYCIEAAIQDRFKVWNPEE